MSLKLKLFSFVDAYASPKFIRSCECVEGDTYAKLKALLEDIHIVDWPFLIFDIEGSRVFVDVYVMPLGDPNLELESAYMWLT